MLNTENFMKMSKPIGVAVSLICLVAVALLIYGIRTDCPQTAGYVDCSVSKNNP